MALDGFGFSPLCVEAVGAGSFEAGGGRFEHLLSAPGAAAISARPAIAGAWAQLQLEAGVVSGGGDSLLERPAAQLCEGVLKPQRACTFQVEEHRHAALLVEYRTFQDSDRRRVAFANVDRYSMQFVTGWPDYDCTLSSLEWEIGTARVLGLPVPSLAPFVGMKIGNSNPPMYVDRHGDNLARVETEGGYFRLAHDAWLSTVFADCAYHGLRVSREVQGLFRACIPLPAERVAFDRRPWATRRGLVPDATLAAGVGPDRLVECKFLHWGVTTYTKADLEHERRCRSVERRAEAVHGEYVNKARRLDARHCGTVPGTAPGPVEARLLGLGEVQPLVVGHYGEVSAFVDELADLAAEFGARKHWRAMRCRDPGTAKGIILQVLRRSWGMAAFRENARLVARRLGRVNDARAQSSVVNTACERRQLRRRYEYASEHHRYGSGRRGSRSP